jgi:hypothetical protein
MWLFGLEQKAHHSFTYQAINPGQSAELNFIAATSSMNSA